MYVLFSGRAGMGGSFPLLVTSPCPTAAVHCFLCHKKGVDLGTAMSQAKTNIILTINLISALLPAKPPQIVGQLCMDLSPQSQRRPGPSLPLLLFLAPQFPSPLSAVCSTAP